MPKHVRLPFWRRPVPVPPWLIAFGAVATVVLTGSVAVAAVTPTYNAQCVVTAKANGGQVLDCDPIVAPTASPTATPSPSASPTVVPTPSASMSPTTTQPPTPSPTVTQPTPSPTATAPLRDCYHQLAACGYPNANNTGPTGPLQPWVGSRTFTTAGQQITDTIITGCVEVRAANVTFRNVQINANGCFWGVNNFSTNLQIIDSAITCGGTNGTAVGSNSLTLSRVEITGCENGLNVSGSTLVADTWIHAMNGSQGGAHTDGAQFNQGASDITFRHNTIDVGPGNGATSAIIMWDEGDPQNRRVTIDNNLLAGGTYTVYCGRTGVVDNIRVTNNRFGPFEFGYANACNSGETWFGNVRDVDGATLGAA
jgi:hypothetical protein